MPYAHSRNGAGDRHDLGEHLRAVADLAAEFAGPFGGEEVAPVAGLLHDIGKDHPAFEALLAPGTLHGSWTHCEHAFYAVGCKCRQMIQRPRIVPASCVRTAMYP